MHGYQDAAGCYIDLDDYVEDEYGMVGIVLDLAAGKVLVSYQDGDIWEFPEDIWVL